MTSNVKNFSELSDQHPSFHFIEVKLHKIVVLLEKLDVKLIFLLN